MIKDKTLDKIMESQQEVTSINCAKKQKGDNSERLTGKDVGGIFIIHFLFLTIATMLALWQFKNPRIVSRAEDLSGKVKTIARRLSLDALNEKDGEFQDELDEAEFSNTEELTENFGHKIPIPQDEESTNNDASSQQKQNKLSQSSLKHHKELEKDVMGLKKDVKEMKKDVTEMKQFMIKILEKIEK